MNKHSLKPVTLLCTGTATAAILLSAAWMAYGHYDSPRPATRSITTPPASWHNSYGYSGQHHLGTMSDAERATLIRLQLATTNGRWLP